MHARFHLWSRLLCTEPLRALARHKLRSTLTALGIMVGVAAVIWVVAIGQAATARAEAELANLGDNLVWVEAGSRNINGVRTGSHGTTSLTADDAQAIRREMTLIKSVAENVDGNVQVIRGNRNWNTRYRGVSPEYLDIKGWQMGDGAFFTNEHVENVDSVVVIGETVRRQIFGAANPIGETIRVQGVLFQVIGLLASKGQSSSGQDQDDVIMMPWTTTQKKLKGKGYEWLDDILCSATSRAAVNPAVDAVTALMRQRHHIGPGEPDDFNIRRPDEVLNAQIQTSRTLELLLISLASISLLVGGIGIMNVMLASVAQRVVEIGPRRSRHAQRLRWSARGSRQRRWVVSHRADARLVARDASPSRSLGRGVLRRGRRGFRFLSGLARRASRPDCRSSQRVTARAQCSVPPGTSGSPGSSRN